VAKADARAAATVKAMKTEEKTILTHGIMPMDLGIGTTKIPADAVPGAGYVAGIERLGVPALKETDASLGVSYVMGLRKDGATALPSGVLQAATWNPDILYKGGAMIGGEARAKGFNVLLAGGVNLMRDPRNGRTFEYLSEDPLLSGAGGRGDPRHPVEPHHFDDQAFCSERSGNRPQICRHQDQRSRCQGKRPAGLQDRHRTGPAPLGDVRL
jgi:hypothetical protein